MQQQFLKFFSKDDLDAQERLEVGACGEDLGLASGFRV
jgi:hypothetical protein